MLPCHINVRFYYDSISSLSLSIIYILEIAVKCSSKNKLKFMLFNRNDEYNFLILFINLTFCFC